MFAKKAPPAKPVADTPEPIDENELITPPAWRGTGRRRITMAEAEAIKRGIIGNRRQHFTLSERLDFLAEYEVIADEPMPIPTSTTSQAEALRERAARAARAAAAAVPPPKPNRFIAAAKVLLGASAAELAPAADADAPPPKHKATFFG
jgi:hypothetical protein